MIVAFGNNVVSENSGINNYNKQIHETLKETYEAFNKGVEYIMKDEEMSEEDKMEKIKEMSDYLICIGSHSHSHVRVHAQTPLYPGRCKQGAKAPHKAVGTAGEKAERGVGEGGRGGREPPLVRSAEKVCLDSVFVGIFRLGIVIISIYTAFQISQS